MTIIRVDANNHNLPGNDDVKHILSLLLIILSFMCCYIEDVYLHFRPPEVGRQAIFTFRAQGDFTFDQEKAYGSKRNVALSQYIPLYSHYPDKLEATKKKMQEIIKKLSSMQAEAQTDGAVLSRYLRKELGIEITDKDATILLEYPNIKYLMEGIVTLEEAVLRSRIVEDPRPIKGKITAEVLFPDPIGTVAYPASEFMTIEEARTVLQQRISQVFWQVDKSVLDPVIHIIHATLTPNLKYDQKENDRRIEEIIRRYPSKLINYDAGDILIPFGKPLTEDDLFLLAAHQEAQYKDLLKSAPSLLLAITFMVILYNLLLSKVSRPWLRRKPSCAVHLCSLILVLVLLKTYLLLSSFPLYGLPFCLLPLLLVLLEPERVSVAWSTLLLATLVSLFSGRGMGILLFYTFGGLLGILSCPVIRKRSHILIPSLLVGMCNATVVVFFLIDWNNFALWLMGSEKATTALVFSRGLSSDAPWAFLGGLASGPLALILVPLFEIGWHRVSAFKLNQYADLQHPLLKDLLRRAPGTYQHTMSVAYLAEAAGETIGANTLLLRTGAYYHDIGKSVNATFFVENQLGVNNLHDGLSPAESVGIIIGHVKDGIEIGRKAGLPDLILDFIPQHHGTQLVEFFFDKAAKENPEKKPEEKDFRYPGPKPRSVEAAILMIVDSAEAASRTLREHTRENIQNLLRIIIDKKLNDGQFDECNLSTRDIGRIVHCLTDALAASFHARVEYPWQKKDKTQEDRGAALEPSRAE
ncbi:MAG: HDIG domain-containing metalloprotein [Syntrophobacter sp.]